MKNIFAYLLLVAVSSASSLDLNELCSGILFATVPHPSDSNLFIGCIQGRGTVLGCNEDEFFDQNRVECTTEISSSTSTEPTVSTDPTTEVPSTTGSTESTTEGTTRQPPTEIQFVCPPSGYGLIPHATNCSRYYECIQSIRYLSQCEEDQIFDIISNRCGDPATSLCATNIRCA